jgi:DNA-binding YbaB/EbfC family protein
MNPFDMGNIGQMLGSFQQRMDEMKKRAESTVVEGTAAGGLVSVKVTCAYECTEVHIAPEAAEDPEMLEDLVRAALNEALRQARETTKANMGELAQGLPIPPGLIPGM